MRGHVFLSMHDSQVNQLTFADFDPYSRQPAYKGCAVRVRPAGPGDEPPARPRAEQPRRPEYLPAERH